MLRRLSSVVVAGQPRAHVLVGGGGGAFGRRVLAGKEFRPQDGGTVAAVRDHKPIFLRESNEYATPMRQRRRRRAAREKERESI